MPIELQSSRRTKFNYILHRKIYNQIKWSMQDLILVLIWQSSRSFIFTTSSPKSYFFGLFKRLQMTKRATILVRSTITIVFERRWYILYPAYMPGITIFFKRHNLINEPFFFSKINSINERTRWKKIISN